MIINCKLLDLQISDVIDYTNFKQSGIQMELEEFSIQEITNELFYLYGPQMNIKQLKMQIDYRMENDCNERLIIRNDKHRLKQVLINLIGNSMKFTMQGSVKVIFSELANQKDILEISVKDTGPGIKQEVV